MAKKATTVAPVATSTPQATGAPVETISITAHNDALKAKDEKIAELELGLKNANDTAFAFHKGALTSKDEKIAQLEADLETAQEVANDAIAKFNSQATEKPKANTIKIGGKVVTINYGVNLNGKDYTAEQLAEDEAAVKELIEMQSGAVSYKGDK